MSDDYEATYDEFWRALVENPDGTLNLDQVKRELHDYRWMMSQVPEVYSHVTGGILSKPNYEARSVINVADEHYQITVCEEVAGDLFHQGRVYLSGGVEQIEFELTTLQEVLGLPDDQMTDLVAEALHGGKRT
jgi:hypothetical protein